MRQAAPYVAACLSVALGWTGCSRQHGSPAAPEPRIGSIAVLGMGASHGEEVGEPCLPSRAELGAVLRARAGARAVLDGPASDDAIPLAPRLRVRILARAVRGREVRLRLLEGAWAGTACWVDGRVADLFAPSALPGTSRTIP